MPVEIGNGIVKLGRAKAAKARRMKKKAATTEAEAKPEKSNSEIVREILASGTTKPADIVWMALEKYDLNISKGLINQVKMQLKKKQVTPAAKKRNSVTKVGNSTPVADGPGIGGKGLPTELDVAKFALKMGGIDKAIQALQDLVK